MRDGGSYCDPGPAERDGRIQGKRYTGVCEGPFLSTVLSQLVIVLLKSTAKTLRT